MRVNRLMNINSGRDFIAAGEYYGYPHCCIEHFINNLGAMGNPKGAMAGRGTGFIPCPDHAHQVLRGEITLQEILEDRHCPFPFPFSDMDEGMLIESFPEYFTKLINDYERHKSGNARF